MDKRTDFIIVGLGLAGACLAIQLLRRGKQILVYDTPNLNRATAVAAGLFNPITGKRIVKTWRADEIFSYLQKFYKEVETELGIKFLRNTPLYTPFRSIEEQNEWMSKSADKNFSDYILEIKTKSAYGDEVYDPLGGILLAQCGFIDTNIFLENVRKLLIQHNSYRGEKWEDEKLIFRENDIQYEQLITSKIIYCTGVHILQNKLFKNLPLKGLKGEVMTIKTDKMLNRIYNRGVYVIESGDMNYKVGATYDLVNLGEGVTEAGKNELIEKAKDLLTVPFKVAHQDWGIRPSTIDRRPLIGEHPELKNILIFNGLGTKGVSLAPYFSDQLAKYLLGEGDLDKEANINRVKSLYSKFQ